MFLSTRSHSLCLALLAAACLSASAQSACSTADIVSTSTQVSNIQHHLASIAIEDMDTKVPAAVQRDTAMLKEGLADVAKAVLACESTNAQPSVLKNALAKALKADAHEPDNATFPWGGDLRITVDQASAPQLLFVQLQYAIECGDDTMLLVFIPEHGHWTEKLLWQSPAYKDDSGAFGDFFLHTILPGKTPDGWSLVIAHGKPWCMSRFSGFDIDVLTPVANDPHPRVLWHTGRGYSRGDFIPSLKASGNIFEFRIHEDEMLFDMDNAFERTVIYRYRINGTNVTRLEPIATTGRGFVEEWFSMPWPEAKDQTLPINSEALQRIHQRYETSYPPNSNIYTSWTAGPVQSCSAAGRFQVAFDSQHNKIVPGKPGGEQDKPVPYYFQIKQIDNGYEMESVSQTSDPTCIGPDLMSKPAIKSH
jgi:hypothetical protein